jgi:hypothetical protein
MTDEQIRTVLERNKRTMLTQWFAINREERLNDPEFSQKRQIFFIQIFQDTLLGTKNT